MEQQCSTCRFWTAYSNDDRSGICERQDTRLEFYAIPVLSKEHRLNRASIRLRLQSGQWDRIKNALKGEKLRLQVDTLRQHFCSMWKAPRDSKKRLKVLQEPQRSAWGRLLDDEGSQNQNE